MIQNPNNLTKQYSDYYINVFPPQQQINQSTKLQSSSFKVFKNKQNPLNQHLLIHYFKIYPCQIQIQHNHKQCEFYHSNKDRRRSIQITSSSLCSVASKNIIKQNYDFYCKNGDNCQNCHNKVEQLYCFQKYKTKFCTHYPNDCINCQYAQYCSFAHTQEQIKIQLIHHYIQDSDFYIFYYKTLWCPFNYLDHDRRQCLYSHNWQDYRRKPHIYRYQPQPCSSWDPNNFITKYENQCIFHINCNKCHGWKQLEYHPRFYKTKSCSSGKRCEKGKICPYYHFPSQKRKLSIKCIQGWMEYYPRNRRLEQDKQRNKKIQCGKQMNENISTHKSEHESSQYSSQNSIGSALDEQKNFQINQMVKKLISQ